MGITEEEEESPAQGSRGNKNGAEEERKEHNSTTRVRGKESLFNPQTALGKHIGTICIVSRTDRQQSAEKGG